MVLITKACTRTVRSRGVENWCFQMAPRTKGNSITTIFMALVPDHQHNRHLYLV